MRAGAAVAEEVKHDRWPEVHQVDLRAAPPSAGLLTPPLRDAIRAALDAGRSVVLVLNRLGYGRALGCAECGAVRRCARCRVALTYHLRGRLLACRLCGGSQPASSQCGRCRGRRLQPLGGGTERLEVEARAAFPAARVARYDSTLSPPRAAAVREAFRAGVVRLVVGTSMAVRLCAEAPVGLAALVHADATLQVPDFRAAERTFQLAWHLAEGVAPGGACGSSPSIRITARWRPSPRAPASGSTSPSGRSARSWATPRRAGWRGWSSAGPRRRA